jgi:hypothetical protein
VTFNPRHNTPPPFWGRKSEGPEKRGKPKIEKKKVVAHCLSILLTFNPTTILDTLFHCKMVPDVGVQLRAF